MIWGVLEFGDAWSKSGEMANIIDTVKWPLDYLLKCHPDENTYYVQVGDGGADHQFWGAAESMNMNRPSFAVTPQNPGTEFAAEGAAALAAGSILFKGDKEYSDLLKAKAKSLFEFANKYRGSSDISAPYYKSYRWVGKEGRRGGRRGKDLGGGGGGESVRICCFLVWNERGEDEKLHLSVYELVALSAADVFPPMLVSHNHRQIRPPLHRSHRHSP